MIESFERQLIELNNLRMELVKKKAALETELHEVTEDIEDAKRKLWTNGEFSNREWYAGLHRSRKTLTTSLYALTAELTEVRAKIFSVTTEYNIERAKLKSQARTEALVREANSLGLKNGEDSEEWSPEEKEALRLSPEEHKIWKEKIRAFKRELRREIIAARPSSGNGNEPPPKPCFRLSEETKSRMRIAQKKRRDRERLSVG
jgi:hypothetical protein